MRFSFDIGAARDWLRTLAKNYYFWGGVVGIVGLGIVGYVLVDAVIMPSYTRHGVAVNVPDVTGQPFEQAVQRVEQRDLQVLRQVGRYNPRVERGTVVDQNPPPNADVKPGRRIYLTVNAGTAPKVDIPDLTGISMREAKNRVAALGLDVGTVEADSLPAPYPNTVTRQRPAPGDSLQEGDTVDLWYSTGLSTDSVQVPNVVGQTVQAARDRLLNRRLRAIVVAPKRSGDRSSAGAAPDSSAEQYVHRQGRAPESRVRAGTEIRLFTTPDSTSIPEQETEVER